MGELVIKFHDFEKAKNEIKEFSEHTATDFDLHMVDDTKSGGEFWGDIFLGRGLGRSHKVNGEELNNLISEVQTHLIDINSTQVKLIKEFGQVFSALEALDKDYIKAILISIKATEETSQSIKEKQIQIDKIVVNQKKTLEKLLKFKQKLDSYEHLNDIDKIWRDCQSWYKEIKTLFKSVDLATESSKESAKKADAVRVTLIAVEEIIKSLSKQSNDMIGDLERLQNLTSSFLRIIHLKDVDEMWESLSSINCSISDIHNKFDSIPGMVSKNKEDISRLISFMERLSSLNHLIDVDTIWKQMKEHQLRTEVLEQTSEKHANRIDAIETFDHGILQRINTNEGYITYSNFPHLYWDLHLENSIL
jgi:hypothetical protein